MKILNALVLLILLLCYHIGIAQKQSEAYSVRGIIADSVTHKVMTFITVNLLKAPNTVLKVDYSKEDGSFSFVGLEAGHYSLAMVGVGYTTKRMAINLTDSLHKTIDLGMVPLGSAMVGLQEVVVTGTKQIVKQEIDRITYDLQADPESKVVNVLEMMRKVPLLSLDADNNILLKGNSDFKILINGKPSSMMERSYKDILRTMPASSIERIEVITSPPAKYDAEGLAGIINIITAKKLDNGYNGSVNINERFPNGGPGLGGSVSAKLGKFGISAFGGANLYTNLPVRGGIQRLATGLQPTTLLQEGTTESKNRTAYLGYEMSYELDSLDLISAQFNLNGNRSEGYTIQTSSLMNSDVRFQGYKLENNNTGNGNGVDASVNYQRGFRADKNRLLTFSYRYLSYGSQQNADLHISDRLNYIMPDYRQVNDQRFAEQTFQVDYVHPVKKHQIEAGLKGILRANKSDFQYAVVDSITGQYSILPGISNRFRNTQNVFGAYTTYQYALKNWGIKAGMRIEQTVIDADFMSVDSRVKRTYINLIPSVSINRKFRNNSGLILSYTQRIQRPGIYQLNPFVDRSNPNFERTGNPDLRPALVNDIQLTFSGSGKIQLNTGLGFTFFRDLIFPVSVYDSTTNITRTSYGNTGTAKLPSLFVNVNLPITKRWNMSINSRVAYGIVQGVVNGVLIKNEGFMYQASLSTSYKLPKDWRLTANLQPNGPGINLQGATNRIISSSFSINKDLVKDKLSVSGSIHNPFRKYRENLSTTSGPDFQQTSFRWDYFRSFTMSLNYKFGKLRESIKKNKRGIRNDDVQSGN
ncbi:MULTISPECIES: outer membrane beta-barrel protein [unclassified Spirosoma]|uniref:outer membrane beta-barrel protein n=1 Tax=unclassified Spirosoma TaxID=2621999 RepID=UPI000961A9ED|nr:MULTISPECIES: outer membrane beta-barrel protein [unclassified Spirosoma]MBN8824701.1 TonB-dependent receptor [Spirosoma sp.]OJW78754.1 MAG: TonB-dependent receptor [Spirosoma sp. 48-14]